LEQNRAEHDIAIFTALAAADMHDHALAVDIADLESRHLGATRAGGVEGHHQDAVEGGRNGIDEPGDFLLAEDGGQATHLLGVGGLFHPAALLEGLEEEETQGGFRPFGAASLHLAQPDSVLSLSPFLCAVEPQAGHYSGGGLHVPWLRFATATAPGQQCTE
jgi:hypothetical protein